VLPTPCRYPHLLYVNSGSSRLGALPKTKLEPVWRSDSYCRYNGSMYSVKRVKDKEGL